MTPGRLAAQAALCGACLVALNVAVGRAARDSVPRRLARAIDASPPVTDLFVGDSLVAAGVDGRAFEGGRPGVRALNAGLGASTPVEHGILLRRALRLGPRRVYYGAFDLRLVEPARGGFGDLVGNRAMAYYLGLDDAARHYAAGDPARAAAMRAVARVPLLVERQALWGRVERLRRRLGGIGLGPEAEGRFGRAADFRGLEAADPAEFRRACRRVVESGAGLAPAVAEILRDARRGGARPVLVEMPMPAGHRRRYHENPDWAGLRAHIAAEVRRSGGAYVDASAWVGDDGFADPIHLGPAGAARFSARLAATTP